MFSGFSGVWTLGVAGSRRPEGEGWCGPSVWSGEVSRLMRLLSFEAAPALVLVGDASGVDSLAQITARSWFPGSALRCFRVEDAASPAARTRAFVAALANSPRPVLLACPWNARSPGTWLAIRCAVAADVPVVLSPAPAPLGRPYVYSSPPLSRSLFA